MKRFLIIMIGFLLLSGCATGVMVKRDIKPEIKAKPDSATLFVIRDTFFGGGVTFWNYVDGKFVGETEGNTYFMASVQPGQHYLVVTTENTAVANIDFQPGKIYFLRQGVTLGVWRARTRGFEPLTYEQAVEAIKGCTYREISPGKSAEDLNQELYKKAIEEYHAEVKTNPDGFKAMLEYKGH
jgi:hypothetical protein